ncbi:MAG TPA: RdgB/HAM1 family non-canonical purine NTP pyrophosphatase [Bacillota bacterium]|nr:RdgB/HAM1 family non-canonical purine NTP pyrophosphatase [Bacillota bacterium]
MKKIIIASLNTGKVEEIKTLFSDLPFQLLSICEIGLKIDVVEDGPDFSSNSLKKAKEVSEYTGEITLADDSGLVVYALDGKPGVCSARFAGEDATDNENNRKLLMAMEGIETPNRVAYFSCVVSLYYPNGHFVQTEGTCHGRIGTQPKGTHGFGYDPLFIPNTYDKTMAELSVVEKNAVSHRNQALMALKDILGQ